MVVNVDVPVGLAGVPVGSIVAFAKSLAGCPTLPDNFEECDGHTCVNVLSPFNGVVIPNLNGASAAAQRFLRGAAASGGVGGADSVALTIPELAAHTHALKYRTGLTVAGTFHLVDQGATNAEVTGSTGSGTAHENRPAFYEVVWVMRVY